jgi:quercetin dioxygenase-like cupin family protein
LFIGVKNLGKKPPESRYTASIKIINGINHQEAKMIIGHSAQLPAVETRDEIVHRGPVQRRTLIDAKDTGESGVLLVTFGPGARLNFHAHTYEQILYVTEGKGIVATREKEEVVTPGDCIYIPAGEVHWHGATEDSSFSHLAIQRPGIRLAE